MRLTRAQLRGEIRTLTAQRDAANATIADQRRRLAELEHSPALIDNIRLAHELEISEAHRHDADALTDRLMLRLLGIAAKRPHLLDEDDLPVKEERTRG